MKNRSRQNQKDKEGYIFLLYMYILTSILLGYTKSHTKNFYTH